MNLELDFTNLVPRKLRSNQNVMAMVRTYQRLFQDAMNDTSIIPELWMDSNKIPIKLLFLKFIDVGWTMGKLQLSEAKQRELLPLIPIIYNQKGTLLGIINLIRLLLGIEVTAETLDDSTYWRVGVSEIGISTEVGIEDPASVLVITANVPLTDEDVINILYIVDYMRVAGTFIILNYPNKVPLTDIYLNVGDEFGELQIGGDFERISWRNKPKPGQSRESWLD